MTQATPALLPAHICYPNGSRNSSLSIIPPSSSHSASRHCKHITSLSHPHRARVESTMGLPQDPARDSPDMTRSQNELAETSRPLDSSEESTLPRNEKTEAMSDSGQSGQPAAAAAAASGGADEYPTGMRLVLLAGASIMGVFLISLDQASSNPRLTPFSTAAPALTGRADHRRHGSPQNHGRVWRPKRRLMVQLGILHDIWRSRGRLG